MSERVIPEKWQSVYRQCEEFLVHPGEPSTKPIEWCVQILDDLADLQAKLEEKARKSEQWLQEWAAMKVSRDNALTENAALKRPVTDEEKTPIRLAVAHHCLDSAYMIAVVNGIIASRTQEAQKGEDANG